jgi:hypothetical protein
MKQETIDKLRKLLDEDDKPEVSLKDLLMGSRVLSSTTLEVLNELVTEIAALSARVAVLKTALSWYEDYHDGGELARRALGAVETVEARDVVGSSLPADEAPGANGPGESKS